MSEPTLHPLVDLAARLLVRGDEEPLAYPPAAEKTLTDALVAAKDLPELPDAVISLFHAAIALSEEESSPAAAAVIFKALLAARGELRLGETQAAALGDRLDDALARTDKRAPMIGEAAPPGAVKVSSFPPPRRFKP